MASRSLRARGLKLVNNIVNLSCFCVALFTGAWIETNYRIVQKKNRWVALFTGAWIETQSSRRLYEKDESRALYGRVD